jgi:predicted alpha/beta hydrolase family esterase
MTNYFIVPGLGNSGPEHGHSYFEKSGSNFQRILQKEWESPACTDWIERIDKTITAVDLSTVVLIGHSLGCLPIVHRSKKYGRKIKGVLLVAPSDPEASHYTFPATGLANRRVNLIHRVRAYAY